MYLELLIAGFGGGIVRGLVGYIKYQYSYKNVPFRLWYFSLIMVASGVIGLLVALAVKQSGILFGFQTLSPALAFFVGYAGGDFAENVYKILVKRVELPLK